MSPTALRFTLFTARDEATPHLRTKMAECWVEGPNAGGAAGSPCPPVTAPEVTPALDSLLDDLAPDTAAASPRSFRHSSSVPRSESCIVAVARVTSPGR